MIEHTPKTGGVRKWLECYDHFGNVSGTQLKMVNGQNVKSPFYNQSQKNISKKSKRLKP